MVSITQNLSRYSIDRRDLPTKHRSVLILPKRYVHRLRESYVLRGYVKGVPGWRSRWWRCGVRDLLRLPFSSSLSRCTARLRRSRCRPPTTSDVTIISTPYRSAQRRRRSRLNSYSTTRFNLFDRLQLDKRKEKL